MLKAVFVLARRAGEVESYGRFLGGVVTYRGRFFGFLERFYKVVTCWGAGYVSTYHSRIVPYFGELLVRKRVGNLLLGSVVCWPGLLTLC